MSTRSNLITSFWLNEVGFKPHTFAGQPNQHWLLWLGQDIGVELSFGRDKPRPWWFSWFRRANAPHTAENLINIRDLSAKHEVIQIVQAVTGRRWNPARHHNGSVWIPKAAR